MKEKTRILRGVGLIFGLCIFALTASASDKSTTIFPAEGNKQCNDYSANSIVHQINGMIAPTTGTVSDGTNSASYTISAAGTNLSFSNSTTPIDYVLVKNSKNVSVIIYPAGGVTGDGNIKLTVSNVDLPITAYSLCYGLGNTPPPPPPAKVLKSCNISSILDQTGVSCPTSGQRTLVCNVELDKPFFGLNDGSDTCCICNDSAKTECNPNVPAGQPNACPKATTGTNPVEVTTHIEMNNDPYYCTTTGGTRTCFPY